MLNERKGTLYLEDVALEDVAERYGTPLYVYSQAALDAAFAAYRVAFSDLNPLICYAVKANGNQALLRRFVEAGSGFDIVSGGELALVLKVGGAASSVIFSGVGKSVAEIEFALNAGIRCFNVESWPELERLNDIAGTLGKRAPVSLRINPDVDAKTHPYISTGLKVDKFGIAYVSALSAYRHAVSLPHLDVQGIDCHIGSQLTDVAPLIEACERMVSLIDTLAEEGIVLSHLDLGGGIGIRYSDETLLDLAAYAQAVGKIIGTRKLSLMLEPGRSLTGDAGVLLTRVEYIKHGECKDFLIVDAAMNDLIRPALYQAHHEIVAVTRRDGPVITADVVGPVCESGDFLGKDRTLAVNAGDLLAVKNAGAYAASMASNYNARPRAAEVMVSADTARLIRRRETHEDLWACEQG